MIFSHDTELGLIAVADLINTSRNNAELLADPAALSRFIREWGWTGRHVGDQAELDAVRALRPRLARLWDMSLDDAVDLVNALLRESSALPQLVRHDGWSYHVHATPPDAPLADRLAVDAAMAFTDVIRAGEQDRLRVCAAGTCDNVLVDLSRNRSRRFCGTTCANRVNVAAYRSRLAAKN